MCQHLSYPSTYNVALGPYRLDVMVWIWRSGRLHFRNFLTLRWGNPLVERISYNSQKWLWSSSHLIIIDCYHWSRSEVNSLCVWKERQKNKKRPWLAHLKNSKSPFLAQKDVTKTNFFVVSSSLKFQMFPLFKIFPLLHLFASPLDLLLERLRQVLDAHLMPAESSHCFRVLRQWQDLIVPFVFFVSVIRVGVFWSK